MFIHGAVNGVHNAPWSDCPNKNVFISDHLNREYDKSAFRKSDGKLFQTQVSHSAPGDLPSGHLHVKKNGN